MLRAWGRCIAFAVVTAMFLLQLHALAHETTDDADARAECAVCLAARVASSAIAATSGAQLTSLPADATLLAMPSLVAHDSTDRGGGSSPRGPPAA